MRYLTVHRERALACFAMQYDCILNREQAAFAAEHEGRPIEEGLGDWPSLRNGGTIRIEIGAEETTFFAVCQTEHKLLCTRTLTSRSCATASGRPPMPSWWRCRSE